MAAMYSSEWWMERLNHRLDDRQNALTMYEDYYLGDHRLSFATSKFRETFGHLFSALAVNFCLLVVDAERERLNIDGFRMGATTEADEGAWKIWQANKLDARSAIAHTEALMKGMSYVLVWTNPRKPGIPLIRVQDARKVVIEYDDGDEDIRLAALKRWVDMDGHENAVLWLPDRVEKYRSAKAITGGVTYTRSSSYWERRNVEGEEWPLPNPLGVVPIVPLVNNPLLSAEGRSELATVIPIQDAINKLVADMIVASEYVAYPQRYATGIEVAQDIDGNPIEPFRAGAGRLWIADVTSGTDNTVEPKFGQFPQASLGPYVQAIEMLVQDIASITKTPPHYLLGQSGNFPSGESLKATETGLVAKSKAAQRYFGEAWEEVMGLAFRVQGQDGSEDAEVIWRDPESRVMSEITDALGKQVQMLGLPTTMALEKAGFSQTEIARAAMLRQQELVAANVTDTITPEQAETVGRLISAGFDPAAALQALTLPPIKHIGLPPVTVQPAPAPKVAPPMMADDA